MRQTLRGYRVLRGAGRINAISSLRRELTVASLGASGEVFSEMIFGSAHQAAEVIARQYLLYRLSGRSLSKALLMATGTGRPLIYPMPPVWQGIVRQHGFPVAQWRSTFLWIGYCFLLVGLAVRRVGVSLLESRHGCEVPDEPRAHFMDLGASGVPADKAQYRNSILGWFLSWGGRPAKVTVATHDLHDRAPVRMDDGVIVAPCPALPAMDWRTKFGFLQWAVQAIVVSLYGMCRGNAWNALVLNQAVDREKARRLPGDALADIYLFHNSNWIYRPLWTYEAERRKSEVIFYFYSTNCEAFKLPDGYPPILYGWEGMTWPRYLVWDHYQRDFVQRAVGERCVPRIDVVGPLPFDGHLPLLLDQRVDRVRVAVFDVQPMRDAVYQLVGAPFEYYVPCVALAFLMDIAHAGKDTGVELVWKKKRNLGRNAHPRYRSFLQMDPRASRFLPVDPDVSAADLIAASDAVISMPFTSTAHIAMAAGKPSVYYDPSGDVMADDRAAHGVPVLQGRDQLVEWLRRIRKPMPAEVGG